MTVAVWAVASSAVQLVAANSNCTGTWTNLAPIPIIPRQENSGVAINSTTLAVLGGIAAVGTGWGNTGLVTYYDIPTDTWIDGPTLPMGLNHPNSAAHGGKIYLLGGLTETDAGPWTAIPETWVLDPVTGRWDSLAPFPDGVERGSSVVGVYGDKMFLAGGLHSLDFNPGGAHVAVDTVLSYDISTNEWVSYPGSSLPVPKDHAGGAVVGNTLWVTGGRHIAGGDITTNDVFALDLEDIDAGWDDLTESTGLPTARGGHMAAVLGDLIYTFGGEGVGPADGVFSEVEVLDTKSRTWKSLDPMPLPRHGTVSVVVGKGIYIPGGGLTLGPNPTNTTEVFRP